MNGDPAIAPVLRKKLRLPVIGAPMFIASSAGLVIEQCKAGIIGAIPALNLRTTDALDAVLHEIDAALKAHDLENPEAPAAPYAVNLVAHRTNQRLAPDLEILVKHKVALVIVSLAAPDEVISAVHGYGGMVFNDIISNRHAHKCAEAGTDGLIAVAAGAGGHTGNISPFALMQELRAWWRGPLALAGCIATGGGILAAEVMGADFAHIGSPFLASLEADTATGFKEMIAASDASDIVVTNCFTGVNATFLRPSIIANGLDPANLVRAAGAEISIANGGSNAKAWRDIWSAGQGIGAVRAPGPAGEYIAGLISEYAAARAAMMAA